jgi:PAS domain S-box-containing protein
MKAKKKRAPGLGVLSAFDVIESIPQLTLLSDHSGAARRVNRRWTEFTGRPEEQLLGSGWLECLHPHDRTQVAQVLLTAAQDGEVLEIEYRNRRHDGKYLWFLAHIEPVMDRDQRFTGWVHTALNVDEYRRAQSDCHQLFQGAPQGVIYQDAAGHITDANPAAQRIFGWTLEELKIRTLVTLCWRRNFGDVPKDVELDHPVTQALLTGSPVTGELMIIDNSPLSDAHLIRLDVIPQFEPGENVPHQVYAFFEDVTERDRLMSEREVLFEQLTIERASLEAVLAQMAPGVMVVESTNLRISLVNVQAERIFGVPLAVGMSMERVEQPTYLPGGQRLARTAFPLHRALSGETVSGEDLEFRRPDGARTMVRASAVPIFDRTGRLVSAVLTCEDLTARRNAEAEIGRLTRSIQRASEALSLHGGQPVTPDRFLKLMGELYGQLGQPQLEGRLIALLLLRAEPVSLGEVARALGVSKAAVSKVSGTMLDRGDLQIIKSFSSREHLLALTDHNYIRDLSVRRVASWAISNLCDSLLESNHLDADTTAQIRTHLETHTRVALALEQVLSPIEHHQGVV